MRLRLLDAAKRNIHLKDFAFAAKSCDFFGVFALAAKSCIFLGVFALPDSDRFFQSSVPAPAAAVFPGNDKVPVDTAGFH